jgi:uncharacterized lipoprotein YddW (UPF0748 family)
MRFQFSLLMIFISMMLSAQEKPEHQPEKFQFRGVWIATVRNLDWPSQPGLTVAEMKAEYIQQLDLLNEIGMNAVIVQVRPSGDAMYNSSFEPWSLYLTGKQGLPPPNQFDPLTFMIEETHARSMEFHAWFNPFRAVPDVENAQISPDHIFHQHPEWFVEYGPHLYFNPGIDSVRSFTIDVIMDVVRRYDIDAVHFDDYYYPYRINGQEYPDQESFRRHGGSFFPDRKDDWRRNNINEFVRQLNDSINMTKPWVHFGISPFGVWRNKSQDERGSETQTLQNNYDDLYGDALKWVEESWLDYILPQCYQYLGRDIMDYRIVTKWWNDNHGNVNYYIGQGPFRLGNPERGEPWTIGNEIDRQLEFNLQISDLKGSAYFRSETFAENPLGVNEILKDSHYRYPALTPASYADKMHVNTANIVDVSCAYSAEKYHIKWSVEAPEKILWYVVYRSEDVQDAKQIIQLSRSNSVNIHKALLGQGVSSVYVTSIDRYRSESEPVRIDLCR